ncbi:hypothetical protein ATCC90586_002528 [Pythium insidiosum]|nr:hypothetical protein ATCC90586_002528 [Pythium insidiosum]
MYDNSFLRAQLRRMRENTAYNWTFLDTSELVLPVVDCTSTSIVSGDDTVTRVFYILRDHLQPEDVSLLTFTMSVQDYIQDERNQRGSAGILAVTYMSDLRLAPIDYHFAMRIEYPFETSYFQPSVFLGWTAEGMWELESIPRDAGEPSKVIKTACRTGFYETAEENQGNIKNLGWKLSPDPKASIYAWPWAGGTVVLDAWAWVHSIHFIFAADMLFNLFVLLIVVYRNARKLHVWVGDAFTSVAATIYLRGLLVLVTWYINNFWTLMEFCLQEGNESAGLQRIFAYPEILHADLLTIFLTMTALFGVVTRERIDPALAVLCFEIGFAFRRTITTWFAATQQIIADVAEQDYLLAIFPVPPKLATLTPFRVWTTHPIIEMRADFILAALLPCFVTFVLIILYVPLRKLYRRWHPDPMVTASRHTGSGTQASGRLDTSSLSWKTSLTVFEVATGAPLQHRVATGAPLQHRVGLVSDYNNCIFIKGIKYASADGIYCNGYVIIHGRFLARTEDLLSILVMIVTRVRFRSVYVYDVTGYTVQQTARLVYPQTMTLWELLDLNISQTARLVYPQTMTLWELLDLNISLILAHMGNSSIRESPLLDKLSTGSAVRNDTVYLQTETEFTFDGCIADDYNAWMYSNAFLRTQFNTMITDTTYHWTFLAGVELIAPVVDCTSTSIVSGDHTASRVFYLVQPERNQRGSCGFVVITFIDDFRSPNTEFFFAIRLGYPFEMAPFQPSELLRITDVGMWEVESVPRAAGEPSKIIQTACRTGFYDTAEAKQGNIKNLAWKLSSNPRLAVQEWPWAGNAIVMDAWAWVHMIHLIFAVDMIINLFILGLVVYHNARLVVYHNARSRKLWLGDAFTSVSSTVIMRGVIVLVTWLMNGFWTLMEFCLQEGNEFAGWQRIKAYPQIIHADFLTIFLSLAALLGVVTRERIDPALSVILFEIGFANRQPIASWFPGTRAIAAATAEHDYLLAIFDVPPKLSAVSPFRVWTTHPVIPKTAKFIFAAIMPSFVSFFLLILYVPLRKFYFRFHPDRMRTASRYTGSGSKALSTSADSNTYSHLTWKTSLTVFEIATGAPLQHRVGLVSDYNNCIFIKGIKYASADGIYCNGYVIIHGSVYVYDVTGYTVQQTARLVYPQTMTLHHSHWQIGGRSGGWMDAVKTGALVAIGAGAVVAAASVGFGFIIFGAAGYGIYSLYNRFIAPYRSHGYSSGSSFSSIQDDIDRIFRQSKGPRSEATRTHSAEDKDVDALLSGLPFVVRGFARAAMSMIGSSLKSSMARAGELRRIANEHLQSHSRVVSQFGSGVTLSTPQNWMETTVNGVGRVEAVFPVVANGFGRAEVVAKASVSSDGTLQIRSLKYRNYQTGEELDLLQHSGPASTGTRKKTIVDAEYVDVNGRR